MDKEILSLIDAIDELIPRPIEKLDDEVLICECFCINVADIRGASSDQLDLDLLKDRLSLGTGCQGCLKRKEDWIDKIL